MQFIYRAREEGIPMVCGGDRPVGVDNGYFVNPTVFRDVPLDAEIWKEEVNKKKKRGYFCRFPC